MIEEVLGQITSREEIPSRWTQAFPNQFPFYHLGKVEMQPLDETVSDGQAVAFQLLGDLQAWMIVLFSKELDSSVYFELGNVLASRFASNLSSDGGIDVSITPPQKLSEAQIESLIQYSKPAIRRTYAHLLEDTVIPIETWVLPAAIEEVGHA